MMGVKEGPFLRTRKASLFPEYLYIPDPATYFLAFLPGRGLDCNGQQQCADDPCGSGYRNFGSRAHDEVWLGGLSVDEVYSYDVKQCKKTSGNIRDRFFFGANYFVKKSMDPSFWSKQRAKTKLKPKKQGVCDPAKAGDLDIETILAETDILCCNQDDDKLNTITCVEDGDSILNRRSVFSTYTEGAFVIVENEGRTKSMRYNLVEASKKDGGSQDDQIVESIWEKEVST